MQPRSARRWSLLSRRVRAFSTEVGFPANADTILELYAPHLERSQQKVAFHVANLMKLAKFRDDIKVDDPRYLSLLAEISRYRSSLTSQMLCVVVEALGRLGRPELLSGEYTAVVLEFLEEAIFALILSSLEYLATDVLTVVAKTFALADLCTAILSSERHRKKNPSSARGELAYESIIAELLADKEKLSANDLAQALRGLSIAYGRVPERFDGIENLAEALLACKEPPRALAFSVASLIDLNLPNHAYQLLRKHLDVTEKRKIRSTRNAVEIIRVMTRLKSSEDRKWWRAAVTGLASLNTTQALILLRAITEGRTSRVYPSKELYKGIVPLLMMEILREIRTLPPSTIAFTLRSCVKLQYWDSDFLAGASKVFLDKMEETNYSEQVVAIITVPNGHSSDGLLEDPPLEDFSTLADGITKELPSSLIRDDFSNADIIVLILGYSRLSQAGRSPEDSKTAVLALHRAIYGRMNSLDLSSMCFSWFLIAVSELSDPALQGPIALATAQKISQPGIVVRTQDAANVILALQKSTSGIKDIEKLVREPLRVACMKAIVDKSGGKEEINYCDHLLTLAMAGPEALRLDSEQIGEIVSILVERISELSQQQQVQEMLLPSTSNLRTKSSDLLALCWSQLKLTQYLTRSGDSLSGENRKFLGRLRRTMHHAVEQRRIPWPELCENIQLLHSAGVFDSLSYEARSELWRSASYRQKKGVPRPERREGLLRAGVDPRSGLKGLHKKFRTPAVTKHAHFQIAENKLVEEKTEPEEEELFHKVGILFVKYSRV
ncbi:hypothetical protein Pmar_PMAR021371 [Perkinsus marinus ATCC 50983]|uniref:Uncharacterized protein n=1 Tax=Perkinsus marinus (strain ATCC 50983 / TXsc) TaxID=423536 RepID=C5KX40_PERM5|nr:hypothetical protein Pmar_PMAR021371 [Perkinsus marinus ATCC 50983]EER10896.1 hypothetical protein Pmar_PMAR021371 [Perkinsus marinus ATCC 50983]|eukprot:XP_002779101.1 hypothetical protein Pmar_PMAR021371 [Perkinsus marinus ATCC 50983]